MGEKKEEVGDETTAVTFGTLVYTKIMGEVLAETVNNIE